MRSRIFGTRSVYDLLVAGSYSVWVAIAFGFSMLFYDLLALDANQNKRPYRSDRMGALSASLDFFAFFESIEVTAFL